MTREESIFYLANMDRKYMEKGMSEALDMAIQALSQEPCENCCNGNQIEKAKLCQKSYLAGMEHKQEPTVTSTDEPMTMVYPTIVCDDAISRDVAIKHLTKARMIGDSRPMTEIFAEIPHVTPSRQVIEDIKAEIMKCRDMSKFDRVYAVHIIEKHIKAESEDKE